MAINNKSVTSQQQPHSNQIKKKSCSSLFLSFRIQPYLANKESLSCAAARCQILVCRRSAITITGMGHGLSATGHTRRRGSYQFTDGSWVIYCLQVTIRSKDFLRKIK